MSPTRRGPLALLFRTSSWSWSGQRGDINAGLSNSKYKTLEIPSCIVILPRTPFRTDLMLCRTLSHSQPAESHNLRGLYPSTPSLCTWTPFI